MVLEPLDHAASQNILLVIFGFCICKFASSGITKKNISTCFIVIKNYLCLLCGISSYTKTPLFSHLNAFLNESNLDLNNNVLKSNKKKKNIFPF